MSTTLATHQDGATPATARRGRWIEHWDPEDPEFWRRTGRKVAARNLVFSIFAENTAFSVWLLWSITATYLIAKNGFHFTPSQLFFLVAVPNLVGSLLRVPYTFAVPKFGGRNWTMISALLLLIPTLLLSYAVGNPATPYWMFLAIAATAGLGGGNFASSMTNINFFYPDAKKGVGLGLNAAGGNIGVSVIQLLLPVIIGAGGLFGVVAAGAGGISLTRAGYVWAGLSLAAAACAWLFMDNLTVSLSSFREQISVVRHQHTWVMSWLYVGTFGSFIGYSAAFPLLIKIQFPNVKVANYAFLGALVGSLARPVGGWLADKVGGAQVTFWNFVAMAAGTAVVIEAVNAKNWPLFLTSFLFVFITTGLGNGSTFRMIPMIFQRQALLTAAAPGGPSRQTALDTGRREGSAVIGLASSVGAFGGFIIVATFGVLGLQHKGKVPPAAISAAFLTFLAFYASCVLITWWYYTRKNFMVAKVPSLATVDI